MPASLDPSIRLLSPEKRRIYPNLRTGNFLPKASSEGAEHATVKQRAGLSVGQADDITWDGLVKCGWEPYEGDAATDERGFIVCGADGYALGDPTIKPNRKHVKGMEA